MLEATNPRPRPRLVELALALMCFGGVPLALVAAIPFAVLFMGRWAFGEGKRVFGGLSLVIALIAFNYALRSRRQRQ